MKRRRSALSPETQRLNAEIRRLRAVYPEALREIPREDWPSGTQALQLKATRVWCSVGFIAMLFADPGGERLSICRAEVDDAGRWTDGITWDELQRLKGEAGFADRWALEIFPPEQHVVNVANMRHLWLVDGTPSMGWT